MILREQRGHSPIVLVNISISSVIVKACVIKGIEDLFTVGRTVRENYVSIIEGIV